MIFFFFNFNRDIIGATLTYFIELNWIEDKIFIDCNITRRSYNGFNFEVQGWAHVAYTTLDEKDKCVCDFCFSK